MRAVDAHARGCDFSSERMPSSATAGESVQNATRRCFSAALTSSSLITNVMHCAFIRSFATTSISASRGSFPSSFAISSTVFPSYFFSSGLRTETTRMPEGPPAP